MKKLLFFVSIFIMGMVIMPNVYAATDYAKVEIITGTGSISNDEQANVTVSINDVDLKWSEADPKVGRDVDGWWIGVKFTAPTNANFDKAQFKRPDKKLGIVTKKFTEVEDSKSNENPRYFGAWLSVDKARLGSENPFVIGTYEFDWNGDGTYEQKVTVQVNSSNVKFKTPENVTSFTVKGANGSRVFTIKDGNKLSNLNNEEISLLEQLIQAPNGKKFVGYKKKDGTMLKDDEEITKDEILEAVYEDVISEEANPNTSDINLYLLLSLIAVSGCGIVYTVKRRFN